MSNWSNCSMRSLIGLPIVALLLSVSACDGAKEGGATAPPAQAKADAAEPAEADSQADDAKTGGDKVKVVEGAPPGADERYELQIDTAEAKAGEQGTAVVRVVPKEPWHMNLDYPTSLKVEAPEGVSLTKAELEKADAAALDENKAQFDVAFTAAEPGERTMTGKFKFAVCQDEACAPVTEDVEIKVAVK